mgnify:CR=1 FL=1
MLNYGFKQLSIDSQKLYSNRQVGTIYFSDVPDRLRLRTSDGTYCAGTAYGSFRFAELLDRYLTANVRTIFLFALFFPALDLVVNGIQAATLWSGEAPLPLLSSFRPEALAGAREGAPDLPRALLLDELRPGWLDTALDLGCVAVVCHHPLLDAASVGRLHDNRLRALAYTVNDPAEARRLVALGVDGLITDAVDRFSPGPGVRVV